jgi:hypothetical protein
LNSSAVWPVTAKILRPA